MKYTINVLSPVHVGTGETLTPLEFITGDRFAVFDTYAFFTARPERAEEFTARLSGTSASQLGTLRLNSLLRDEEASNRDYWAYSALLAGPVKAALGQDRLGEVRRAIKTPDGRPYIPATSIKGAIRTALAYFEYSKHEDQLQDLIAQRVRDEKDRHQTLQRQIFLALQGKEATHDYLRALSISDPEPVAAEDGLMVAWGKVLSSPIAFSGSRMLDRKSEFKSYNLFSEAVRRGVQLTGRLDLNQKLLSSPKAAQMQWQPHQAALSIERMCEAVNAFAADVCKWEREYFHQVDEFGCDTIVRFYEGLLSYIEEVKTRSDTLLLSIGQGSGWHKMTVGLLLEKAMPKGQFDRIRTGTARRREEFQYPKSRKLVMRADQEVWAPFGWIAFRLPGAPPVPKLLDMDTLMAEQPAPSPRTEERSTGAGRRGPGPGGAGGRRPPPRAESPPRRPEPPLKMPAMPRPQPRPAPSSGPRIGERINAEIVFKEGGKVRVRLATGAELDMEWPVCPRSIGETIKVRVARVDASGKVTKVVP